MIPETVYSSMVHANQLRRVREFAAARRQRIDSLGTKADALAYQKDVRARLRKCFGEFPQRTPLTPRVTGVIDRPTYTIEKVMYQSRPNFWVTASLYIPKSTDGRKKFPAVLGSCGHASDGKAIGPYQSWARTLAHQGFVVLLYDPIGQGERHQYLPEGQYLGPTSEHNIAGNQMALVGEFFGSWRAWDGIRSLDYLLTRPEVDKKHVGMSGNSGGGTLTAFVTMLDKRITMAAPSCMGSDYLTNLENELVCDSEQNPPGAISSLLNYADFFIAQAPRPTIVLCQKEDFFDIRGVNRIYDDIQKVYSLLGGKDVARIHRGEGQHGYSPELREAMCRFFREIVGYEDGYSEPDWPLETEQALAVTPTGQVKDVRGSRRVHDFTLATAKALAKTRKPLTAKNMVRELAKVLVLPARKEAPHYRTLRARHTGEELKSPVVYRWGVETEPDILAVLAYLKPAEGAFVNRIPVSPALNLHLPHISAARDINAKAIVATGDHDFALDVRGIGVSRSLVGGGEDDSQTMFGPEFFHAAQHQMMAETYIGKRVHDALATLDLLASLGATDIHLTGRGLGGFIAAFAGLMHDAVTRVTLRHMPRSFHDLTQAPVQRWPLSTLPYGILKVTDLPEMFSLLKKTKKLKVTDPWNAKMEPAKRKG